MERLTSSRPPPTPTHDTHSNSTHGRVESNAHAWSRNNESRNNNNNNESEHMRGDASQRFHDMMERESLASSHDSTEVDFEEQKGRAPRIADKVARRLRKAELREQRAERLIEKFAVEVEELTLRVEREQLANEQLRALVGPFEETREKMKEMNLEKLSLEKELRECRQEVEQAEQLLKTETAANEAVVEKYKADIESVKAEREAAKQTLKHTKERLHKAEEALAEERRSGRARLETLDTEFGSEQRTIMSLGQEQNQLSEAEVRQRERILGAQEQVTELRNLAKAAQRATSEAEQKAVSASQTTQALAKDKAQLQERVAGLEDEVRVAKRSLDLVLEQRSKTEGKLDAASTKLRRLKKKYERYTDERQRLQHTISQLRQSHASATEAATRSAATLAKRDETIVDLKERIKHLKSSNGPLRDQHSNLGAKVSLLQDTLNQFSNQGNQDVTVRSGSIHIENNPASLVRPSTASSSASDLEHSREQHERLRQTRMSLLDSLGRTQQEKEKYKHALGVERQRNAGLQCKASELRTQLARLQESSDMEMERNRMTLNAKQAESDFVWRRLDDALRKDRAGRASG